MDDFAKAIALRKDYVESYNNRGVIHFNMGSYPKAIADFTEALAINPRSARAFFNRAIAFKRSGFIDRAIDDLAGAIAADPFSADAHHSLANLMPERGRVDAAIEELAGPWNSTRTPVRFGSTAVLPTSANKRRLWLPLTSEEPANWVTWYPSAPGRVCAESGTPRCRRRCRSRP